MQTLYDQLENQTPGGYSALGPLATEPTAWAALALASAGRNDAAGRAAQWLADIQARGGSVATIPKADGPCWTTSLAILAWQRVDAKRFAGEIERGCEWLLAAEGTTCPQRPHIGHNTTLVGWSWAADTHSWLEPTAFATMALTTVGRREHSRTREAVTILTDRLLRDGGCNYGNTEILGQTLLPHLQPSGIVLWALAAQEADDPRVERSLAYIEQQINRPTGCASLAFALIALTAWNRRPMNAEALIADAISRPRAVNSPYKLALLTLASDEDAILSIAPARQAHVRQPSEA